MKGYLTTGHHKVIFPLENKIRALNPYQSCVMIQSVSALFRSLLRIPELRISLKRLRVTELSTRHKFFGDNESGLNSLALPSGC